jgi:membrane protein YdbS with pleckstrin-like domain
MLFREAGTDLWYEPSSRSYYSVPSPENHPKNWVYLGVPIILGFFHMIDAQTAWIFSFVPHRSAVLLVALTLLGILMGCLIGRRHYLTDRAPVTAGKKLDTVLINDIVIKKMLRRFEQQLIAWSVVLLLPFGALMMCWYMGEGHLSIYLMYPVFVAVFAYSGYIVCPFSKTRYLKERKRELLAKTEGVN